LTEIILSKEVSMKNKDYCSQALTSPPHSPAPTDDARLAALWHKFHHLAEDDKNTVIAAARALVRQGMESQ
jgi:hypothetical protein